MAIRKMSPSQIEQLKAALREELPTGPDGHIAYEAFANAVRGGAPGQRGISDASAGRVLIG